MTKLRHKKIGTYIFLSIVSFISVFPLYWMIAASTNSSLQVTRGKLTIGSQFFVNLQRLTDQYDVFGALWNSLAYSFILTLLSLLICSLAGYGFEVYHDKVKDNVMKVLLLAMMVPFVAIMIPLYQMFSKWGLLNSLAGFILPTLSTPFLIMLFRQSARSFPRDIIEAARIDGLNELQIFFTMFIPTMRSTFAAALTITFMGAWNSYLWPKVIMTKADTITIPMLVANLKEGYVTDYGVLMLAVLLCTLPTAIVFFILQKNFTAGITGAVK